MDPMAEMVKADAATKSAFFRPNRSVIDPEITQPAMVPRRAEETTQPNLAAES